MRCHRSVRQVMIARLTMMYVPMSAGVLFCSAASAFLSETSLKMMMNAARPSTAVSAAAVLFFIWCWLFLGVFNVWV